LIKNDVISQQTFQLPSFSDLSAELTKLLQTPNELVVDALMSEMNNERANWTQLTTLTRNLPPECARELCGARYNELAEEWTRSEQT
jgi:hypothetical protein